MPTFSEEGWAAICHRKLVVNLSLFLAHSGSFFRFLSPQKSKDNGSAMHLSAAQYGFLFIFNSFPPFLYILLNASSPATGCQAERWSSQSQLHFTLFHIPGERLTFGSILLLSPLNGTRAKDSYTFHAIQHIPVLFSSPFPICICQKTPFLPEALSVSISWASWQLHSSAALLFMVFIFPALGVMTWLICHLVPLSKTWCALISMKKILFPSGWPGSK